MALFGGRRLRRDVRGGGRVDQGAVPALPPDQGRRLVGPPARDRVRAHRRRRGRRPVAGGPARRARPARPDDGVPARPRTRLVGPGQHRPAPLPVRRGAGDPAGAGPTQGRAGAARWPGPHRGRRPARRLRRAAPVLPHPRAGGGVGRDRRRPRASPPDEPAAPGRGRLRQDHRRAPRDAPGRRLRRSGRAPGADRGAGPAAPAVDHRDARRPRRRRHARRPRRCDGGRAADRLDAEGGAGRGDAPGGERRGRAS